jgi:alpha-1,2-mannosyltransferase
MITNHSYFRYLQKLIKDDGLTGRIKLIPNVSKDEMLNAMYTSMVYLHTMNGEHFGISIVEAMAAGLIPVVPAYGGCSEIVPKQYQYTGIQDASDCISKNIEQYDGKKRQFVHAIAKQFSTENFRQSMKNYIQQAYENSSILEKTSPASISR